MLKLTRDGIQVDEQRGDRFALRKSDEKLRNINN